MLGEIMKKIYIASCITICLFILAFLLVGCGRQNNNVPDNLSDARYGIFDAQNEQLSTTFIYGERENPYKPDGVSNSRVNFGIISVVFPQKQTENEFEFTLKSGDKTFTGKIEKSPFTEEYLADIGSQITTNEPIELTLKLPTGETKLTLEKRSENWEINFEKALKIGENALKDEIREMSKNGSIEYYLKIISNNKTNFGTYFWAFTAISENGEKHTVIFSPTNEAILVKN